MTKHSALTDSSQLHYAKMRSFTGNKNNITPEFIDQLLVATDTNKIYRSTGISQGDIIELVSPVDWEDVTNKPVEFPPSAIAWDEISDKPATFPSQGSGVTVGFGYPVSAPLAEGQTYFDSKKNIFYCAVTNSGYLEWRSSIPEIDVLEEYLSINGLGGSSITGNLSWVYQDLTPQNDYFRIEMNSPTVISGSLYEALKIYGSGVYALFFEFYDPNNEMESFSLQASINFPETPFTGAGDSISLDKSCFGVTVSVNQNDEISGLYISADRRMKTYIRVNALLQVSVTQPP